MNAIRLMLLTTTTTATHMQHALTTLVTLHVNVMMDGKVMEKHAQMLMSVLLILLINATLKQPPATTILEACLDINACANADIKKLITRLGSSAIKNHDSRLGLFTLKLTYSSFNFKGQYFQD